MLRNMFLLLFIDIYIMQIKHMSPVKRAKENVWLSFTKKTMTQQNVITN